MRRHSRCERTRNWFAACATGKVWHNDRASASNNKVKPLPGRAHGTSACVVLPQALQSTRGTSACSHASNWKKSKCRQLRLIRSWTPCPSTPQAGHDTGRLQTQRGGKQGFDGNTHQGTLDSKKGLSDMVPEVNFHWKRYRATSQPAKKR